MIVTLDTGILVRATHKSDGPARRLVEILFRDPQHTVVLSRFIISEVGKVLSYPRLYELFKLTPEEVQEHPDFLLAAVELVDPLRGVPVILADPKDDTIFYTALAAGADVLCVRDRDFYAPNVLDYAARHDLAIMDDSRLLALLESKG